MPLIHKTLWLVKEAVVVVVVGGGGQNIMAIIKFRYTICYTFIINCTRFEKIHGFSINMQ